MIKFIFLGIQKAKVFTYNAEALEYIQNISKMIVKGNGNGKCKRKWSCEDIYVGVSSCSRRKYVCTAVEGEGV